MILQGFKEKSSRVEIKRGQCPTIIACQSTSTAFFDSITIFFYDSVHEDVKIIALPKMKMVEIFWLVLNIGGNVKAMWRD